VAASGSSRLLRFVQFPSFLRDWQRLRLGDEALRALEREHEGFKGENRDAARPERGRRAHPKRSLGGGEDRCRHRGRNRDPADRRAPEQAVDDPYLQGAIGTARLPAGDVKRVRELLGASQAVMAGFLGVNVNTVRSWEQGKRLPQPIACRFLSEIESDPVYWRQRIGQGAVEIEPRKRAED